MYHPLLKFLNEADLAVAIGSMERLSVSEKSQVCAKNEAASSLYIVYSGTFEVVGDTEHKIVGRGASFGDASLVSIDVSCLHQAAIFAKTDGQLFTLAQSVYQSILSESSSQKRRKRVDFLLQVKVLQSLDQNKLELLAGVFIY